MGAPARISVLVDTKEALQSIRAIAAAIVGAERRVEAIEKRLKVVHKTMTDMDITLEDSEA